MGEVMIELILPWPPTVNSYYVKNRAAVYISPKGKNFRDDVAEAIMQQAPDAHIPEDDRIMMEVVLFPPDKRKRDLDNHMKALLDAMTKVGLWEDDSQIDQLQIYRGEIVDKGMCHIRLYEAGPIIPKGSRIPD